VKCAKSGPQDCDPNHTPAGFFCCLTAAAPETDAGEDASACIAAGGFCASGDVSCAAVGAQDCGVSGDFCCLPNLPDAATACIDDASVKLIQASDYDQSCTVDTDCQQISEGNACVPCAFGCPLGGAINVSALPKYMSDIANTPAVGSECPVIPCIATVFPCCIGGNCQVGSQCANPVPTDAATDSATDGDGADGDACAPPVVCGEACISGAHNVSTMVGGCLVTRCCVPDDAGTD
jgi:hypothetical protein